MPNPSLLIASDELSASSTPAETLPFDWITVHQTVLKFVNPLLYEQPIAAASHESLLTAMERLVAIINLARSSPLKVTGDSLDQAQTLEALLPYVSEEAYDVLDALRAERQTVTDETPADGQSLQTNSLGLSSPPSSFTTIENLIPSLLWRLARSAYSAMHLIEGIRGKRWQPEQGWACGMLRLVVMLEVEAPSIRWCFDLATGYPAETLLEQKAIIQSDEPALPLRCTAVSVNTDDSPCQVQHQLQAVLHYLQSRIPGLQALLQGVPIEILQPGAGWQAGHLWLRFGFDFSAQTHHADSSDLGHSELIEAELMEETVGLPSHGNSQGHAAAKPTVAAGLRAKTHVSVRNPIGHLLSPTTLVQLTKTEALERYAQATAQQQLKRTLSQLRQQQLPYDGEQPQLALIVQAAIDSCDQSFSTPGLELLHPMLLMDELVPKLLWSITSSTHDMMQLVGGIPAQVLQPHASWQHGTLRLLATLQLKAANVDYRLDLSTGRSIGADVISLDVGTMVQTNTAIGLQPTPLTAIIDQLQQQLNDTLLAYRLLNDGVAIQWLENIEQDWQSGTMQLSISLTFIADAL